MEVKGHQMSNVVNYALWLPNLEESLMQVNNNDDLHGGQRSNGIEYNKLCFLAINLVRKITDDNDDLYRGHHCQKIIDDNDDLNRGQRSTEVKCGNLCYMATTFGVMYR